MKDKESTDSTRGRKKKKDKETTAEPAEGDGGFNKKKKTKKVIRVVCLSDTHCLHETVDVPDGDLLIHCGDFTTRGPLSQTEEFNAWLGRLPHRHKVVVCGNHEAALYPMHEDPTKIQAVLSNACYLQDSAVTFTWSELKGKNDSSNGRRRKRRKKRPHDPPSSSSDDAAAERENEEEEEEEEEEDRITIYGSPWIGRKRIFLLPKLGYFYTKVGSMGLSFALPSNSPALHEKWGRVPRGNAIDFLVTHQPPQTVLDGYRGRAMGCPALLQAVREEVRPKVHVFGHVHDAHGVEERHGITFVNAANYLERARRATVFEYDVGKRRVLRVIRSAAEEDEEERVKAKGEGEASSS
ncbi:metallophosphoesterase domain-containing protein 1 [Balamuthia mandrillaris]